MRDYLKCLLLGVVAYNIFVQSVAAAEGPDYWFEKGGESVRDAARIIAEIDRRRAKKIILFIGDGMGLSTVTAARILEGQIAGGSGEENLLSFEGLPHLALAKTYNTNQQVPDSAGTMTAMMSGIKTKAGLIGVNEFAVRRDCASSTGNEVKSLLEIVEDAGWATGIVSTARITHATPAATYAHSPERDWEATAGGSCRDIAAQLIEFPHGDGIEVVLGGGRSNFIPVGTLDQEGELSKRTDSRDLRQEWLKTFPNSAYVWNETDFDAIDVSSTDHLLGLFDGSHMEYEQDRPSDSGGEPSLSRMTEKAMALLERSENYFLMVEAGRIDHGHHAGNAFRALTDTIEFSNAVRVALEKADDDTLIIVTADHSHVFTIAGYPTRGNPILGKVIGNDGFGNPEATPALADDGYPYTTLGYANGKGFAEDVEGDDIFASPSYGGRADLTAVDTEGSGYHQESLVQLENETHSGEDVVIYATGPGSALVHGVQEQNVIFHIMVEAAGIKYRRSNK